MKGRHRVKRSAGRVTRRAASLAAGFLALGIVILGNVVGAGSAQRFVVDTTAPASSPAKGSGTSFSPSNGANLTVSSSVARVGQVVQAVATGLGQGAQVQFTVCGDGGSIGSAGCDQEAATTVVADGNGLAQAEVKVVQPPVPCPCVVAMSGPGQPIPLVQPIDIAGIPSDASFSQLNPGQVGKQASAPGVLSGPDVVIKRATLVASGGFDAWLGGPGERTLVLIIRNRGQSPSPTLIPTLTLKGGLWAPLTIDASLIPPLGPGASATIRVPVALPALALGTYTVEGSLSVGGTPLPFSATLTVVPWGLVIVLLVPTLLWTMRRSRARLRQRRVLAALLVSQESAVRERARHERADSLLVARGPRIAGLPVWVVRRQALHAPSVLTAGAKHGVGASTGVRPAGATSSQGESPSPRRRPIAHSPRGPRAEASGSRRRIEHTRRSHRPRHSGARSI